MLNHQSRTEASGVVCSVVNRQAQPPRRLKALEHQRRRTSISYALDSNDPVSSDCEDVEYDLVPTRQSRHSTHSLVSRSYRLPGTTGLEVIGLR
jgi:hypothetical protein